ncbi:MAG: LysR substrate-binding domain-containing protein [Rhodoferax sp.]
MNVINAVNNIGPRDLEAILAVAQFGSFRAAATALGLSQPSVSARIRHAEDVLGVKLFHRTTRKVTITAHGARLAVRAEQTMAELRALVQEFKDEARLKRGRVVVGATPAIAGSLLPSIIQKFRQRWPGIEVVLRDDFLGHALDRVHLGDVDFAVTPSAEGDDRFECETLTTEEFLILAPRGHPLVRRPRASLAEAALHPMLTLPQGTATRELLNRAYAAEGLPFQPTFETHNMVSVLAMVKAGFGFSVMPKGILALFNMDELKTARIGSEGLYRSISITRAKGRAIQPPAEALIKALRQACRRP